MIFPCLLSKFRKNIMSNKRNVSLNKEQGQLLIDIIKKMLLTMDLFKINYQDYILLNQVYDALMGNTPDTNKIPDESLRGNDSCNSGQCD